MLNVDPIVGFPGTVFPRIGGAAGTLKQGSHGVLTGMLKEVARPPQAVKGARSRALAEFVKHERKWKRETIHLSNPGQKYIHPSYARIIGLGARAIPLILASLQREPADWFYALRAISGRNPVPDRLAGDVTAMTDAWVRWAVREGYLR